MNNEEISNLRNQMKYLGLYSLGVNIDNAETQFNYLANFLDNDEKVIKPLYVYVDYRGSTINKDKAAALFFTNKRILIGYKYGLGFTKGFESIPFDEIKGFDYDDNSNPIIINTRNKGDISFLLACKGMAELIPGYFCDPRHLRRRIVILCLEYRMNRMDDVEDKETLAKYNELRNSIKAELDIYNAINKITCFNLEAQLERKSDHIDLRSSDDIEYMTSHSVYEWIDKSGVKDVNPIFYFEI